MTTESAQLAGISDRLDRVVEVLEQSTAVMSRIAARMERRQAKAEAAVAASLATRQAVESVAMAKQRQLAASVVTDLLREGKAIRMGATIKTTFPACIPGRRLLGVAERISGIPQPSTTVSRISAFLTHIGVDNDPGVQVKRKGRKFRSLMLPELTVVRDALASYLGVPPAEVTANTDWEWVDERYLDT